MKWLVVLLMLLAGPVAAEQTAATLFSAKRTPAPGAAVPVGTYAKGCAQGNVELPETGPTWQAMRLSRDRNWGNPVLVDYLQDLSAAVTQFGWKGLYIGDLGNPRGGPMNSGHASHQMGLDADIWFLKPDSLTLSAKQREKISSISIRTDDQLRVNSNWDPSYTQMLKAAASDPRVDRIFVAAAIKIEMCKTATAADAKWLQHIRPEANHQDHLHVRLKCPPGSGYCQTQTPTVAELSKGGSGCDDTLMYWVSDAYLHPKPVKPTKPVAPKPHKRTSRELLMSDLPPECTGVLNAN
jgi:penicillin-insensitive murein endopeptidase